MAITDVSIDSLESTLSKLQNSYDTMSKKGANTTLVMRRLVAVKIGLDSLSNEEFSHDKKATLVAINELRDILSVVNVQLAKATRKTLLERRIKALQEAISSLENRI